MTKEVLIITYYWPPSGGAGVQRWLKFVKYLPEFGWEPVVLTVDPEYATYPVTDETLIKDVDSNVEVIKTKSKEFYSFYQSLTGKKQVPFGGFASEDKLTFTQKVSRFIRGNFFIPDPRKGWNKYALKKASELIRERNIKYVITTSPPHSTQLIGLVLKRIFDINWIADFRDPWTDISYYDMFYPTRIARKIDKNYEIRTLQNADKIITVSPFLNQHLSGKIPNLPDKVTTIYNGYDEEDFKSLAVQNNKKFTISYIGTLSDAYPIQTFAKVIQELNKSNLDIQLCFVGRVAADQTRILNSYVDEKNIAFIDYQTHTKAIQYMSASDALLLIIPEHPQNKGIITGKIFEYLASKKPIILIGPVDGDAANIIKETESGVVAGYRELQLMIDQIKLLHYNFKKGVGGQAGINIGKYSRKSLTEKLSEILNTFQ